MSCATRNGTARQSLASQIDRLDKTLDGLADNLNEAVATAVDKAVQQTLQGLMAELLTNPDLAQLVRGLVTQTPLETNPPENKKPRPPGGGPGFFARVWEKTRQAVRTLCSSVGVITLFLSAGGKHLAGLVGAGLGWLWSRIKDLTQKGMKLVGRPVLAAWSLVRGVFVSSRSLVSWAG